MPSPFACGAASRLRLSPRRSKAPPPFRHFHSTLETIRLLVTLEVRFVIVGDRGGLSFERRLGDGDGCNVEERRAVCVHAERAFDPRWCRCAGARILAFLPLLGWAYWLIIPLALVDLTFGLVSRQKSGRNLNLVVILVGVIRLMLGGGII